MSQDALQFATRVHGLGQLDQAEAIFRSIPAHAPEYADAVTGLAVIAYQKGRPHDAVTQFSRLVALRPTEAAHHSNLGECLRECGRLDEALVQLRLGLSLDQDQPDAFNSVGLIHHARHEMDRAEEALNTAIRLRPAFPMAMINLGMVLQERRRLKEAANWFRAALALEPDHPMGNSNLGQILVEIGRVDDLDEAEQCCLKAVRLNPDRPQPINNLGNVYRSMGRYEEAVECYQRARKLAPHLAMPINNLAQAYQGRARYAEASDLYLNALQIDPNSARFHANYASLLAEQEHHEDAITRFRHALHIDPTHAESYCGLGQAYLQTMDVARSETCFRKALELDPELTAPRLGLSNLYAEMGDFANAEAEAKIALESHPKLVEVHYQRVTRTKGKVTDDELDHLISLLDTKYLSEGGRSQLNFALGVVHDKRKNYQVAAEHFQLGNAHQTEMRARRGETYDADTYSQWIGDVITHFPPALLEPPRVVRALDRSPIFVVGLPRSGTTLTEQILASHSAVHGAGECMFMNTLFKELPATLGLNGADSFAALHAVRPDQWNTIAESYMKLVAARNPNASFFVDKMPDNVNLLGWIHRLFPTAKVIHCRRDLRDIALSCWQTCFGSIRWANDWITIARRFADYLRVVDHWKRQPSMQWLDYRYESVIADPDQSARQLLEYVGLDWEPSCLNFHETKRQVRTASLSQVREPIYKTSVAKWRNYEQTMQTFIQELERLTLPLDRN